jgi:hypothetical protein
MEAFLASILTPDFSVGRDHSRVASVGFVGGILQVLATVPQSRPDRKEWRKHPAPPISVSPSQSARLHPTLTS